MLTFGGTISQRTSLAGTSAPGFSVSDLGRTVEDLDVDLDFVPVAGIGSKDVRPRHWAAAVEAIAGGLAGPTAWDALVVLHGTDTLHYTSAALSFMLGDVRAPVVVTGSMRPGGDHDSDSRTNFRAAVLAACHSGLTGVVVVFSSTPDAARAAVFQGTNLRKAHSTAINAFAPHEVEPLGEVIGDRVVLSRPLPHRLPLPLSTSLVEDVPIIKVSPGLDLAPLVEVLKCSSGVVIEGTGVGHVPSNFVPVLAEWGRPIVITTQTAAGGEHLGLYEGDRTTLSLPHLVQSRHMASETAQVKLMWALAQRPGDAIGLMRTNVCGELS